MQPATDEMLELMFCTCNRKYTIGLCPCIDNSLMFTDTCTEPGGDNTMIVEEALEMDYVTRAMNNGILSRCSFFFCVNVLYSK